VEGE
jgi:hypothetical protein